MLSNVAVLSLALAVGAMGLAGYALLQERSDPTDLAARLDTMEEQMVRMEHELHKRAASESAEPSLSTVEQGVGREVDRALDALSVDPREPAETPTADAALAGLDLAARDEAAKEIESLVEEAVEEAVEKKAAQMREMRNKKPGIDAFAKTLELTDLQRKAAEEDVLRAQHEVFSLLDVPAEDGTNFMDEVVEIVADSIANPDQKKGRFVQLFTRLGAEKVPGTDETYAERIEASKQRVRESFKRNWSEKQYATFETWQMDPTEIRGIEGSPQPELARRVMDRARALGAQIPDQPK